MEKITLCGDNCLACPRYLAQTEEQLQKAAELWHRVGWRETVVSPAEMRCGGCTSHKACTYRLVECTLEKSVAKCSQWRGLLRTSSAAGKSARPRNTPP